MFRKALPLTICCLLLLAGCEKKEPEQAEPPVVRQERDRPQAPQGMVAVREQPPLFVTEEPVKIRDYVQYLRATGQEVPVRLRDAMSEPSEATRPVSGLTRKQAERYAAWAMKRLPTQEEWNTAGRVIGPVPYPWGGQAGPSAVAPRLYLMQDWRPGSEGEKQARQAKQQLRQDILSDKKEKLAELQSRLTQLAEERKQQSLERWQAFKQNFFQLVDEQKKLAEQKARREARNDVVEILQRIARAKGQLAARLRVESEGQEEAEAAVKQYEDDLARWRGQVEQTRQNLEERAAELQEQVRQLTKEFDRLGPAALERRQRQMLSAGEQAGGAVEDLAAADERIERLEQALQRLQQRESALAELPSAEALQEEMQAVQKQIDQLPSDEETRQKIADLRTRIDEFGETIEQEFLDERLLLKQLDPLVEAKARREAVTAALAALKGVAGQLGAEPKTAEEPA